MVLFLGSCDLFAPGPDAPGAITATPGDESITISWNASPDATSYDLYYTNDGSTPTLESTKVTDITATSYVLSGLSGDDSAKSYVFALTAKKDKKTGDLSSPTSAVKPLPVLTVNLTTDIVLLKCLLLVFEVPYDTVEKDVVGSPTLRNTISSSLGGDGKAVIKASFDRSKYLGYAIVIDLDDNGKMSTGDLIEPHSNAKYTYHYWTGLKDKSFATDAVTYLNDLEIY